MVTCSISLWTRMFGCQKSLSLTFCYKSFSTCWNLLELGIFQTRLTNSQMGSGFKAWPLNYFLLEFKLIEGKKLIKRRSHTSSSVACCEIAYDRGWTKGTKRCSWTFRSNISPEGESQCDCILFRKPVHISWPVWRKSWVTVEDRVQALLTSVDNTPLGKVKLCDIHTLAYSLELRKACGLDGIPNKCFRHLPRNRSLMVTMQGLDFMAHPLYRHTYIHFQEDHWYI
jgi:hypothetical protein